MSNAAHFLYFAFGSNLMKERLQLMNPSAVFHCTGRLKDYRLNFGLCEGHVSSRWHGGVATIENSPGNEVWGVIWKMSNDHLASLDRQEGVGAGMYCPLEVNVETDQGKLRCKTYQMNKFQACLPSPQYKKNALPPEYIRTLEALPTNQYNGSSVWDDIQRAMK